MQSSCLFLQQQDSLTTNTTNLATLGNEGLFVWILNECDRCLQALQMMNEQALVHVSAPSSCQGPGHQTALHRAAMVGKSDAMAALIQGGCAVDLQDRDGNTALHEVSWHGFYQCVKLLLKAGARVHLSNKAGNTALHLACQNAHAQTARLLLLGGSTPDTKNKVGDTCLHVAARYDNLSLVKILLSSLCSVTDQNQEGDTALHVAAALNHKKTVQLLLEAGTDGKIRNNAGKTALDKARDNNHKDLAILLASAPEVHRFMRGRTIRKPRERLIAERKTQSVTREDSISVVDCPSSEQMESRTAVMMDPQRPQQQQLYNKTPVATCSRYRHHKARVRKQVGRPETRTSMINSALDEDNLRKCKTTGVHMRKNGVRGEGFTQLYTLYCDEHGNASTNGCHCKTSLKHLEGQVNATQEEMRLHIMSVQEQVNSRMDKMDQRTRQQIKVLSVLNQERAAAERKNLIYWIERRAAQDREEALKTQATASHDVKSWWMSHQKDLDVHVPTDSKYYKLLPSPSVEQSDADLEADVESLPLLSVKSGDSSTSLANYVNILPSTYSLESIKQGQVGRRTYFEMRVERSPDDYENTALFPLPDSQLDSTDPSWQCPGVQGSPGAAVVPLCGDSISSSSSQSSISEQGPTLIPQQEHRYEWQQRNHFRVLMNSQRNDSSTTVARFTDCTQPSFQQEKNRLHAMEVTHHFFDTVSTHLEHWYERKLVDMEQQMEVKAQQDRKQLLQRISTLEEELQRLRTSDAAEM
ncbi:ankyrin repeat domain-containing protein 6-like isoform X2 [Solea senegalensis]|uniref:Ankyrin repeat domain-containing protein 6-like isoform X2 n=1 Tax=Solea senegalensis TaxID=28829 RepID=A0AAV6RYK3_SOLSE|nr:ankyrin repeat domain-containing protein 6-like isoform X2 [Solea senegalensis]KAG7509854.1 ankyrin repeat domain-containing protein 6-like isoform X2 [Solea senegalensis]